MESVVKRVLYEWCVKFLCKSFPQGEFQHGEFDPGSELTLAARLKHASQTGVAIHQWRTGE
jgi:hypothetical protein